MNDTNNMWQECPTGELQEFVGRQAKRDRRRDITRRAAGGVLIAALVLIAVFVRLPSDQGHVIAGLSCRDVGKLAERYIARELDVATEGNVKLHLVECKRCRKHVDRLLNQPQESSRYRPASRKPLLAAVR